MWKPATNSVGTECRVKQAIARGLLLVGSLLAMAGCSGDTTGPAASTGPLYWQLQLNHHAITLSTAAPHNTIHLTATPVDAHGVPIATQARPVFTVVNDTNLAVDSTGLVRVLRAVASTPYLVTVVAQLTLGSGPQGLTLADTAVVSVVNGSGTPLVMDSLLFRPVAGDSAVRAEVDTAGRLATQTLDFPVATAGGTAIPNAVVHYASSDPLVASFAIPNTTLAPVVSGNAPGVVLLTAEATVYGTRKIDSLWYTVGYPLRVIFDYGIGEFIPVLSGILAKNLALPNRQTLGTLTIGQGGVVLWGNTIMHQADDSLDVQFEDTTNVAGLATPMTFPNISGLAAIPLSAGLGGNIPPFRATIPKVVNPAAAPNNRRTTLIYDSTSSRARRFPVPGTYRWHSVHQGISGTVVVVADSSLHPR